MLDKAKADIKTEQETTETWESLDEAEQSAIVNGMTQGNEAHEAVWQDLVQENIDGAKEMGVQFYTIDKTAFIELPSPCATSSVLRAPTMPVITRTSCPMYRLDEEGSIPC